MSAAWDHLPYTLTLEDPQRFLKTRTRDRSGPQARSIRRSRSPAAHHEHLPAPLAGLICPVHPRALRTGLRLAQVGTAARRARLQKRQKARRRCGGQKVGRSCFTIFGKTVRFITMRRAMKRCQPFGQLFELVMENQFAKGETHRHDPGIDRAIALNILQPTSCSGDACALHRLS